MGSSVSMLITRSGKLLSSLREAKLIIPATTVLLYFRMKTQDLRGREPAPHTAARYTRRSRSDPRPAPRFAVCRRRQPGGLKPLPPRTAPGGTRHRDLPNASWRPRQHPRPGSPRRSPEPVPFLHKPRPGPRRREHMAAISPLPSRPKWSRPRSAGGSGWRCRERPFPRERGKGTSARLLERRWRRGRQA